MFEEYIPSCLTNTVFVAGAFYLSSYSFSVSLSAVNSEPLRREYDIDALFIAEHL